MSKVVVVREPPKPPAVQSVTITLNEEEAECLAALLGWVTATQPIIYSIYNQLYKQQIYGYKDWTVLQNDITKKPIGVIDVIKK